MERRYWLHRISHEWEVSYSLLEKGYLSIGWRRFLHSDILAWIAADGEHGFNTFMARQQETGRSRWNLWYFCQFRPGDRVVVPLFDHEFTIVEVTGTAFPVDALCGSSLLTQKNDPAEINRQGIRNTATGKIYDIGFLVKVKALRPHPIKRSFADARLSSKMKLRQTNAEITSIAGSIEAALSAEAPASLHAALLDASLERFQNVIQQNVTPDGLERLVCWYMKKKGASSAWIPAKNERDKKNGADADVIAEFEALRVIFYIQVKKHQGQTSGWAVHQVAEYASQKQDDANDYTYIPWVISTAEFDADAVQDAKTKGVRLIGGGDFMKMLLDCGIDSIDEALKTI